MTCAPAAWRTGRWSNAHILVDPRISISEGHSIAEIARSRVLETHEMVSNVLVHVEPEDDPTTRQCQTHAGTQRVADTPSSVDARLANTGNACCCTTLKEKKRRKYSCPASFF